MQLVFDAIHIFAPNECPSNEMIYCWVGTIFIISKALGMTIVTVLAFFLWQFSLADLNVLYKRSQNH